MKDHVSSLAHGMHLMIDAYDAAHDDCDMNDIMSAVALLFVELCKQADVPRSVMLGGINMVYEEMESQSGRAH